METQTQPHTNAHADQAAITRNGHGNATHQYARPRINIAETQSGFLVEVEMPGVKKDGVEITFENGELTLVGHRAPFETKGELLYREMHQADYRRVFEVDSSIDSAHIGAQFEQGVLTLTLPKAETAKARKIEISGLN